MDGRHEIALQAFGTKLASEFFEISTLNMDRKFDQQMVKTTPQKGQRWHPKRPNRHTNDPSTQAPDNRLSAAR